MRSRSGNVPKHTAATRAHSYLHSHIRAVSHTHTHKHRTTAAQEAMKTKQEAVRTRVRSLMKAENSDPAYPPNGDGEDLDPDAPQSTDESQTLSSHDPTTPPTAIVIADPSNNDPSARASILSQCPELMGRYSRQDPPHTRTHTYMHARGQTRTHKNTRTGAPRT